MAPAHKRIDPDRPYNPPRHTVLLLSCMDARLIDEMVQFMDEDNLTNRYDHIVFAGASLGVQQTTFPHWRPTFFEHLSLAIQLHDVRDIYIVEHRNCGAYREFQQLDYGDSLDEMEREEHDHARYAFKLADDIRAWWREQNKGKKLNWELGVRCFLMDLRGHAMLLESPAEEKKDASSGSGKSSKSTGGKRRKGDPG